MRPEKNSFIADVGMMLFLILTFISILFIVVDTRYLIFNIIMLNVAYLVVIITYFTSLTTGLIINVIAIFIYFTFTIYGSVVKGTSVATLNYFWIFLLPLYTILVGIININIKKIQDENELLNKQNKEMLYIDEITGLKNLKAFENDAEIFMGISRRYNLPLSILIIKLKYYNEVEKIMEKDKLTQIINKISQEIQNTLRTEDNIFIIDKQDITWGALLLTDEKGIYTVKKRIRDTIQNINLDGITFPYKLTVEIKMGSYLYDKSQKYKAFALIENAKKELEYDVN